MMLAANSIGELDCRSAIIWIQRCVTYNVMESSGAGRCHLTKQAAHSGYCHLSRISAKHIAVMVGVIPQSELSSCSPENFSHPTEDVAVLDGVVLI